MSARDLVGPACRWSGLRALRLSSPPHETPLQRRYRLRRLGLHAWNQRFWADHNRRYKQEREEFYNANRDKMTELNADLMSVFYKSFLDKNWKSHVDYNIEWYKKNISLLGLSYRVSIENFIDKMKL